MEKLILLIDDDVEEMEILNEALGKGKLPATCLWAEGLEHAMRLLQQVKPDYIFIDINMPGADGLACLQELSQKRELSNIPMVIYSTSVNDDTKRKAKEKGAVFCMQKPDNITMLVSQMTAFLKVTPV